MKKQIVIFASIIFFLFINPFFAQDKTLEVKEAIANKDYTTVLNIAKEFLIKNQESDALKILIQMREIGYNKKELYELLGDTYSKIGIAELALNYYGQAEVLDSLNLSIKFKSAEILYKEKRYTDAVNKYLKIVSIDPKNSKAYLDAAQIFYSAKLYQDAAVMFEKYLMLDQSEQAYLKITKALIEIENYDKAYNYAVEGLGKYPEDNVLKKNAAISSLGLKKFNEAAKYYSSLPDSELTVNDLVNAGRAFQFCKVDSMAIRYFENAIKIDSTLSNIYMDLANYNYLNKRFDVAVKYYDAKIKADTTFEPAYRYMAFALMQQQKYDETRQALLKATALNDTIIVSHFWLAQSYRQLDSLGKASEQYLRILELVQGKEAQYKDEIAEANGYLGQRAFEQKRYAAAIGYLKKAVSSKPNLLVFNVLLASSYHQNGNIEEAIRMYKRVLALDPKNKIAKKGLRMLSAD